MAATLACGDGAGLSHGSAAAMLGLGAERGAVEVTVGRNRHPRAAAIRIHRPRIAPVVTLHRGIPATEPARTLIDLASYLPRPALEAAVNAADKHKLIDPEALRSAIERYDACRGAARLRAMLDRETFVLTDSELERLFLPIARSVGLPVPQTRCVVNGFRVDFYWPELGLVVETDGLRYHRTPAAQARDRLRDQVHAAAGVTSIRFTHGQIRWQRGHVGATLAAVARRITSVA